MKKNTSTLKHITQPTIHAVQAHDPVPKVVSFALALEPAPRKTMVNPLNALQVYNSTRMAHPAAGLLLPIFVIVGLLMACADIFPSKVKNKHVHTHAVT